MDNNLKNVARYFAVVDRSLFLITGKLDYDRLTEAIIKLANAVHAYADSDSDPDNAKLWSIGEFGNCALSDFIVGAYWHFTEWHGGQWSKGYAALCALGQVFSPGMTCGTEPETSEHDAYVALNQLAENEATT